MVILDDTTFNLIKHFKMPKCRGLQYHSQFDYTAIDVGIGYIIGVRQLLYAHTQFRTLHNREIIQMHHDKKTRMIDSHYY